LSSTVQGTAQGGERLAGGLYFPNVLHTGGGSGDTLVGGHTADQLHDDGAAVTLVGGAGNDQYFISGDDDLVVELPGGGIDWAFARGRAVVVLGAGMDNLVLIDGNEAYGNALGNHLVGNAGDNVLAGDVEVDTERWLHLVRDTLEGGAGNDLYFVTSDADQIVERADEGHDTVVVRALRFEDDGWYTLAEHVESLLLEAGSVGRVRIEGNGLPNLLQGGAGNDTLIGGTGRDTLVGMGGGDEYSVDDPDDQIIEAADGGYDGVASRAATYALPAHVENLGLLDGALVGIGNDLRNWIKANTPGDRRLEGGAGNDTLVGFRGDDTYVGGAGNDEIDDRASYGTAVYEGPRSQYTLSYGADHAVTVQGAEGTDRLLDVNRIRFADGDLVLDHRTRATLSILAESGEGQTTLRAQLPDLEDRDGIASVSYRWTNDHREVGLSETLVVQLIPGQVYLMGVLVTVVDLNGHATSFGVQHYWREPPLSTDPPEPYPQEAQLQSIDVLPGDAQEQWVVMRFDRPVQVVSYDGRVGVWLSPSGNGDSLFIGGPFVVREGNTIVLRVPAGFLEPGARIELYSGDLRYLDWGRGAWFDVPDPTMPAPTVPVLDPQFMPSQDSLWRGATLYFLKPIQRGQGDIVLKTADGEVVARMDVQGGDVQVRGILAELHWPDGVVRAGMRYLIAWDEGVLLDATSQEGPAQSVPVRSSALYQSTESSGNLLFGTALIDAFAGSFDNDTFVGGQEDDKLEGSLGIDTAVYFGNRKDYSVAWLSDPRDLADRPWSPQVHGVTDHIAGRDGADRLEDMERLHFEDYRVDLTMRSWASMDPKQVKLLQELYVAFFNRIPEAAGMQHWLAELVAGTSLDAIAERFHEAGIAFGVFEEGMTHDTFIAALYTNVLGRGPESGTVPTDAEIGFWRGLLEAGSHARGGIVLKMLQDVHAAFEDHPTYGFVERLLDHKAALAQYYAVEQGLGRHTEAQDIAFGRQLAALVTPDGFAQALALIGIDGSGSA
jgi:Ca2+-binding RTX toxin-like protein